MLNICYGINNSHEPNFFRPFISHFEDLGYKQHATALDYIEVPYLVEKMEIPYKVIGKHYGKGKVMKSIGMLINDLEYLLNTPSFDISISHGNTYSIHTSLLRNKPAITFTDNDINYINHKLYFPYVNFLFTPKAIPIDILLKHGAKKEKIIQYDGYKEDIYISDYEPDIDFKKNIPFENFVTVRAESLQAIYVSSKAKSIVPVIFENLLKEKINVLFLPRYDSDKYFADNYPNVYVSPNPVNGLDACYYSDAVLTGAGTFAREAALLGTPAVSFFPGKKLLSVDKEMIKDDLIIHSRDADEITNYVLKSTKKDFDKSRSQKVKNEVLARVENIISNL